MHPALRLRRLSPEERSVIEALLSHKRLSAKDLMAASRSKESQSGFSRITAALQSYGLIDKAGRQAPWHLTDEAMRFVIAPQQRNRVPFDDARVIGHGKPFLSIEQSAMLDASIDASRTDASTFIKSLSERFVIDLSWASSKLEGNTYDYLDTEKLIRFGDQADNKDMIETTMILNHKRAVEWMLDIAESGRPVTTDDICILHAHLMRGLLPVKELGSVRNHTVKIGGTSYTPTSDSMMLRAGLVNVLKRAEEADNPHEASLGILAGLSYLQAFADGNKRTARLLASVPLLREGYAPLSFVGWDKQEYTVGLVVYYETGDPSILADGFVKNQIDNSPVYQDLIRAHRIPGRIEITRRDEIAAALTDMLSERAPIEDAVAKHFLEDEREDAIIVIAEIYKDISEVNAAAWGVDPELLKDSDRLTL